MNLKFLTATLSIAFTAHVIKGENVPDSIPLQQLQEVVITGQAVRQHMADINLGLERLELSKFTTIPVLFGENDIIKSISLLPGVHSENEGAGGFEVRGGTSSQNLILLDGITLYNPSHVMGIFSTFNDNSISRVTLYKGPIPVCYGGATSSVLETIMARGDMNHFHTSASIGILAAKFKIDGPLIKNKISMAVTARRSYVDLFLKAIPKYRSTIMNFYDLTAKISYSPRTEDFLDISFIAGHDNMAIDKIMGMYWGNIGASINWDARRFDSFRFVTTGAFTNYAPDMEMSIMNADQKLTEYVRNFSINEKISCLITDLHEIEFGVRSDLFRVKSIETIIKNNKQKDIRSGWQNAVWINYEGWLNDRFNLSGGLRASLFSSLIGNKFNQFYALDETQPTYNSKTYINIEPRINLKYNISPLHNIKTGVGISTQNIHAIRSSSSSFPFDRYALTSAEVKPERSVMYGIGYNGMTESGDFDWSVEGFYRDISNIYDFRDGRTMFSMINLENIILGGKGRAFGLELLLRKNNGALNGWLSYTLSKSQTKIPGINNDQWYAASNDRRHDLSATITYNINDRWIVSGVWSYSSGQPLTAPDAKYELDGVTCYYYSKRNGYKIPDSHHLDISATYTRKGRLFTSQWSFGIYNVYCHLNPFVVYFENDNTKPSGTRAVQQSLFGLIPSVSYTLKF